MAYGPRFVTLYRQHSRQLVKVLEGISPSDIPLLNSPTTFTQIINLRIAQAFERMRRRVLIIAVGGSALWPAVAWALQSSVPVIGFLSGASADTWTPLVGAFRQGLDESGYVEGKNVALDYRWANYRYERLPDPAADSVRRQAAVIVATGGPPSVHAAMAATKTIPIVFTIGADPVQQNFVTSLGRPGGNVTGVTMFTGQLLTKRLQLLHELIPSAASVAALMNPHNPASQSYTEELKAAGSSLGLKLQILMAGSERDLEDVFETLREHTAPMPFS